MPSSSSSSSEWLYFASGALLPTLAYVLLWRRQQQQQRHPQLPSSSARRATKSSRSAPAGAAASSGAGAARAGSRAEKDRSDDDQDGEGEESSSDEEYDDDDGEGGSEEDDPADPGADGQALACSTWGYRHAPYKMMLVVNQELGMGKGKVAAQCGHASVGCYKRSVRLCPGAVRAWERTGCAKVAVKCGTAEELGRVAAAAAGRGVPAYLVEDAGRTQIAAGSRTVLALFGPAFCFEGVTDHLKLM
jgi:PTH2 family peptidyl-tRNA hydrolase